MSALTVPLNRVIKPVARSLFRRARTWVQEPEDAGTALTAPTLYPWINALHARISARDRKIRPDYLWGTLHGAHLAKALGLRAISVIEFGVAGGNGLLSLELIARHVSDELGVLIAVYGFDTGGGLPPPVDWRDCPNSFAGGDYPMDVDGLRRRLSSAELVLGLVAETVPAFIASQPAPTGFIAFDLDLYSSTNDALELLKASEQVLLPRVHCYFDDITGFTYASFNGERLSIAEFNAANSMRKISPIYGARHYVPRAHKDALWCEKFFMAHIIDHPMYQRPDGLVRTRSRDLR